MYTLTDLGAGVLPFDLDEDGVVVGQHSDQPSTYDPEWRAVYWDPKTAKVVDLSKVVGHALGQAIAIGDEGRILAGDGQAMWQARVGSSQLLQVPLRTGSTFGPGSIIVGDSREFRAATAIAGSASASPIDLPWQQHKALGMNAAGTIVGVADDQPNAAWLKTKQGELRVLASGPNTAANAIDDGGSVVGSIDRQGFLVLPSGAFVPLTNLPTGWYAVPSDIAAGRHVGTLYPPIGGPLRAYVGHGAVLSDLTELVIGAPEDLLIEFAPAINRKGWICAWGQMGGEMHGFLLRPFAPSIGASTLAVITHILVGGVLGDGGIGLGGSGPVPIPPHEWFRGLSDTARDALIGAAMAELATMLSDRTSAAVVDAIALERLRAGLESALARVKAVANACDDDSST